MLLNLEFVMLVVAIGFVAAAILVEVLADIGSPREIDLSIISLPQWFVAVPVAAFGGPYWVARECIQGIYHGKITLLMCAIGLMVSLFWSFFAGIFVVEFLHMLQLV